MEKKPFELYRGVPVLNIGKPSEIPNSYALVCSYNDKEADSAGFALELFHNYADVPLGEYTPTKAFCMMMVFNGEESASMLKRIALKFIKENGLRLMELAPKEGGNANDTLY